MAREEKKEQERTGQGRTGQDRTGQGVQGCTVWSCGVHSCGPPGPLKRLSLLRHCDHGWPGGLTRSAEIAHIVPHVCVLIVRADGVAQTSSQHREGRDTPVVPVAWNQNIDRRRAIRNDGCKTVKGT